MYENYTPHVTINRDPLSRAVGWTLVITGVLISVSIILGWIGVAYVLVSVRDAVQSFPMLGGFGS